MYKLSRALTIVGIASVFAGIFTPLSIYAQTSSDSDDIESSYTGLVWSPDGSAYSPCLGGGGSVSLVGNSNVERAFYYFIQIGLTEEQSAGIVGNLYAESGVDPQRVQGSGYQTFSTIDEITPNRGYGIAQWTTAGRQEAWKKFTIERNANIIDLGLQLDFLWHEISVMSPRFYGYDELLASQDVRQATWIFLAYFERPRSVSGYTGQPTQPTGGTAKQSLDARTDLALGVLEEYGGQFSRSISPSTCILNTSIPDFAASGVRIDGSPPWNGGANCSGGLTAGAEKLRRFILDTWQPPVTGVGGYACRSIVGNSSLTSIHGVGRALDIYISALDPETKRVGDEIVFWLINNSQELGLQRVIWNKGTWSSDRDGWRDYCPGGCGGKSPHTDHIHAEINEDGANMLTSWYGI